MHLELNICWTLHSEHLSVKMTEGCPRKKPRKGREGEKFKRGWYYELNFLAEGVVRVVNLKNVIFPRGSVSNLID